MSKESVTLEDVIAELLDEEELKEFKASFGVDAEVPEPTTKQTDKRRGDNRNTEKEPHPQGSSKIKTKMGMIADMIKHGTKMPKEDLAGKYAKFMGEEVDDEMDDDEDNEKKKEMAEKKKGKMKESYSIDPSEVDLKDSIENLFGDNEDLSEDFKSQIVQIVEATVVSKINEQLEKIVEDASFDLVEQTDTFKSDLNSRIDEYLGYVVEKWMEDNEVAIETGIKSQIAEDFMSGLRSLFEENYIDVPEDKVDVVEELSTQITDLENKVSNLVEENIELKKNQKTRTVSSIIEDVADDLTETDKERFRSLAEGLDFDSEDDFKSTLFMIKENYFSGKPTKKTLNEELEFEPLDDNNAEEKNVPAYMRSYVDTIKRQIR